MSRSTPPPGSREVLFPVIVALLAAERRIAMLERRLGDARWLGPDEAPSETDKQIAKRRVRESLGAFVALPEEPPEGGIDDDDYLPGAAFVRMWGLGVDGHCTGCACASLAHRHPSSGPEASCLGISMGPRA